MNADDPRIEHLRAWDALPWVANGRATPEQVRWVTEHLAGCEDCRAELAWQQRLVATMAGDAADPAEARDPDTEAGLEHLLGRLDAVLEQAPSASASGRGLPRLTWALAAAVVAQAVGLGVMSLQLAAAPEAEAEFRTLSEAPRAAPMATLRVLPDAGMLLADWQALLQAQGLQVVAGPNAAGAYALAPAPGQVAAPADQVLARLRATPGVRLAEPIGGAP